MTPLVIIPARGGSKGLPGKNIKILGGKPLIHYTIEAALESFENAQILVSSDNDSILNSAKETGIEIPFKRPDNLSSDTASSRDVILHAMDYAEENNIKYDCVILLQPTSPFRTGRHIKEALALFSDDLDMVVSVQRSKSNPYFTLFEEDPNGFLLPSKVSNSTSRQEAPNVYEYNGAIYIINKTSIKRQQLSEFSKIKKYVMSEEDSVDIDTPLDWTLAETLISRQ